MSITAEPLPLSAGQLSAGQLSPGQLSPGHLGAGELSEGKPSARGLDANPRRIGPRGAMGLTVREVRGFGQRLGAAAAAGMSDDERLDLIRALEDLQGAAWAAQAMVCAEFAASQRESQRASGVPADDAARAVADDLALARKESPFNSSRQLSCALALTDEMPQTMQAVRDGVIKPRHARTITEASTCLDADLRRQLDAQLVGHLAGRSDRAIRAEAHGRVYRLDPQAYVARGRRAVEDRYVSIRPKPDVMAMISAYLPAAQGVACHKALKTHAEALIAAGDPRTRSQIMADTFVARITGREAAVGPDFEVGLIMSDSTLVNGDTLPAVLDGYGPVPAQYARDLLAPRGEDGSDAQSHGPDGQRRSTDGERHGPDRPREGVHQPPPRGPVAVSADKLCLEGTRCTDSGCDKVHSQLPVRPEPSTGTDARPTPPAPPASGDADAGEAAMAEARVWLRRLYTDPETGVLTRRDVRRRLFTGSLRALIVSRDQYCRTPWCGAPIRHIDHLLRHRHDGQTDELNGQGLCARCNLARERPRQVQLAASGYLPADSLIPGLCDATPDTG